MAQRTTTAVDECVVTASRVAQHSVAIARSRTPQSSLSTEKNAGTPYIMLNDFLFTCARHYAPHRIHMDVFTRALLVLRGCYRVMARLCTQFFGSPSTFNWDGTFCAAQMATTAENTIPTGILAMNMLAGMVVHVTVQT